MTDINETKLTAYALGGLSDAEAAKVQTYLKDNPDAQQTVDEVRKVAGLLQTELANEPMLELTGRQRSAIEAGRPKHVWRDRFIRAWPRVAAILVVGLTVAVVALALRPPLARPLARADRRSVAAMPEPEEDSVLQTLQSELVLDKHVGDRSIPDASDLPWDDLDDDIDSVYKDAYLMSEAVVDARGRRFHAAMRTVDTAGLAGVTTGGEPDQRLDEHGLTTFGLRAGVYTGVTGEHEWDATLGRKGLGPMAGLLGDKGKRHVTGNDHGLREVLLSDSFGKAILTTISVSGEIPEGGARMAGADRGGEGSGRTVTGQTVETDEIAEKIKELRAGFRGGGRPADQGVESDRAVRRAATVDPRKVIYTATMRIATTEAELAVSQTRQLAEALGGYMQQMTKSAIIIRVPVTSFDAVLSQLAEMGTVVEQQIFGHDVTEEYVDLEIRLKTAKAMLTKLVELLDKATDVKKALMVEREIGRVQLAIDRIEGRLKLLANRTAYATITVNFIPAQHVPTTMKVRLPFSWLGELGVENLMKF